MSIFQNFQSLNLRLTANASESDAEETTLSNNFRISGNGIVLLASDSNPLMLQKNSGDLIPLSLQSWEEISENSFSLSFSEDITLSFNADESGFDIISTIPNNQDSIIIPYETVSAYNITDVLKNRIIVKSRDEAFSLVAGTVTTNTIQLSPRTSAIAQVSTYEETQAFSYNSIVGMENTTEESLNATIALLKNQIIRSFESAQGSDATNEKFVAAYIAELALQGRYAEAITNISAAFINGNNRTYFTAPYFNTLVSMNQTLIQEKENVLFSMQYSLERNILDVYKLDTLPTFLLQQRADSIEDILTLPVSMETFEPTVQQATGIIDTYVTLSKNIPTTASILEPVIEKCIEVLQSSTILNESQLTIVADDEIIDTEFSIKAGAALRNYGNLTGRSELIAGGTMLIVSALQNISSLSANTMAYIYPYVISDNPYYPHADVLGYNNGTPIWMWNIIPEKTFSVDSEENITFNFNFPVTEIYHSIITGIEPFEEIQIYGLDYATDARFETYNAPGYVYIDDTGTLLLRYRQRNEIEEMRLIYEPLPPEPTEPSAEGQATTNTQIEVPSESL